MTAPSTHLPQNQRNARRHLAGVGASVTRPFEIFSLEGRRRTRGRVPPSWIKSSSARVLRPGELNDLRILKTVERLGYAGVIGCEYQPAAGTVEGLGWMQGLAGIIARP